MKIRPDVNDTLQNEGSAAVRDRLDRATKYNGPNGQNGEKTRRKITATPYVWCDPKTIPPRDFLYGYHYVRRYVSLTVAMGGVGKSSEILTEIAAMITGRELLGIKPSTARLVHQPRRPARRNRSAARGDLSALRHHANGHRRSTLCRLRPRDRNDHRARS